MSTIKQNDINEDFPTAKTVQHTADAEGKPAASSTRPAPTNGAESSPVNPNTHKPATPVEFSPSPADERRIANKLAGVGVTGNIALSAFKLFAGIFGNSAAMVSDAVHSLSDVAATACRSATPTKATPTATNASNAWRPWRLASSWPPRARASGSLP